MHQKRKHLIDLLFNATPCDFPKYKSQDTRLNDLDGKKGLYLFTTKIECILHHKRDIVKLITSKYIDKNKVMDYLAPINKKGPLNLYVGRSANLGERIKSHIRKGKRSTSPLYWWLEQIGFYQKKTEEDRRNEIIRDIQYRYLIIDDHVERCYAESFVIGFLSPPFNMSFEH